jgi:DNA-binding NarL/FixJ family response regulator
MNAPGRIRIILGDNQVLYRAGVAEALSILDGIAIVARCADLSQLLEAIDRNRRAIIIAASTLRPDWSRLRETISSSQSRLIVVAENVESSVQFITKGADGVIFRDSTIPILRDCVQHVAAGRRLEPPSPQIDLDQADIVGTNVRDRLTPRELEVLSLLVQGWRNKEIATRLNTTEQVIKNYLRAVFDKAGVSDRYELALFTVHHRPLATIASIVGARLGKQGYRPARFSRTLQIVKAN